MAGKASPLSAGAYIPTKRRGGQVRTRTCEIRAALQDMVPTEHERRNWTLREWEGGKWLIGETHRMSRS